MEKQAAPAPVARKADAGGRGGAKAVGVPSGSEVMDWLAHGSPAERAAAAEVTKSLF